MSYIGYILIGIAINGFFSIYLPENNPAVSWIAWFALAVIGGFIVLFKTFRFSSKKRLKIIAYDLIYLFILIFFALFSLPYAMNFIWALLLLFFSYTIKLIKKY